MKYFVNSKIYDFIHNNPILMLLILSCAWFLQLEIGNGNDFSTFEIVYIIFDICSILAVTLMLTVLSNSFCFCLVFNFLFLLISVTNYFVVQMRGTPLSTKDIGNAQTALNVLRSYSFYFGWQFWCILFLFGINCFFFYKIYRKSAGQKKQSTAQKICLLMISSIFLYIGYFSPEPVQPSKLLGWSWESAYYKYGYLTVSIDILGQSFNLIDKPDAYSVEKVENYNDVLKQYHSIYPSEDFPDIILIVNESWYDMTQIADYETNIPVMPFIDNLTGIQYGHAVVPNIGGGTNLTEYEILTGNSLQLLQGLTPFNVLDLKNAASIVSILNRNGYDTASLHPASSTNYNRKSSYATLGIRNSYWKADFDNWEIEGSHWFYSDKSNFINLMKIYEDMSQNNRSIFLYNLTVQNHGDYLLNSEDENIIKILSGMTDNEDKKRMEEYLTCLHKTDEAFQWLTEYLSQKSNPVVVMMVGDYSPNFVDRIVNKDLSKQEKLLYEHSTPFIIWANYELEEKDYGYISSNYLAPLLLDCARVSSSKYFSWMINDLMDESPIITSFNCYVDQSGNYHTYEENPSGLTEKINMYFNLEYNNITEKNQFDYFQ